MLYASLDEIIDGTGEDTKDLTNADRIRSMSDEELAEWILWTNTVCDCCAKVQECDEDPGYKMCKDGVFDWLKQPVKDGEDDG